MNLLGKASDPKFWSETVRNKECYKKYVEERLADWERLCEGQPIYELRYSAFKKFFVTGERKIYEDPYFSRRGKLATAAVLALIFPEEQKYIDYLNDIIFAICDEYTWCVSAHHPKLEVNNRSFIDLFASETGFALAEIYTMLGDRLEPLIRERIKVEIDRRIIDSFMSDTYFWWEKRCTNNWAAVCGGSVGCTFMLMRPELFDTVKPRLDDTMNSFLAGFKEDGYCLEGTSYWHYGFGYFLTYAEMVKKFTDGATDYFTLPKIRSISTFLQKMFLTERCAVSFADGDISTKYHLGTLHFLKKLYPDDVKVYSPEHSYHRDGCFRFALLVRSACWLDEDIYNHPEPDGASAEYYAEQSKWYVKRTETYGFAAKAGNNNEHHNHNDVGTFIFAKCGKQLITDMGRGVYTKQYFRPPTRYAMIECSSLGHNVPFFGEDGAQKFGSEFAAKNEKFEPGKFSMDIDGAYNIDNVKNVNRIFITENDCVKVHDSFVTEGDISITERLISFYQPIISDGSVKIENAEICFDKNTCDVSFSVTKTSKGADIYLIDFKLKPEVSEFEITIK